MLSGDLIWGIFFLSQTGVGVLGNSALLIVFINIFIFQSHQRKPTDLILTHLTMANTATLLTRGVPETMMSFGMKNILNDVGCQVVMFTNRVSRGLSICTTCLLSVFQAITISPSTSRWARLKPRAPDYILPSFLFFWILNILIYFKIIISTQATKNVTFTEYTYTLKYCSSIHKGNYMSVVAFLTAMTLRDLLFVCLMSWVSGYMVIVLYQHHSQVQHIHSTSLSPTSSVETRAIQTILLLVSCFVFFYWVNSSVTLYISFVKGYSPQLQNITSLLSVCYPSLCPLVLISRDPRVHGTQWVLKKENRLPPPPDSKTKFITSQLVLSQTPL